MLLLLAVLVQAPQHPNVCYEVFVRSFYDSNGDGVGDFAGLTEKLDYVASLGVTAIWLLPFYPSPLRDEGYDISDYESVNPIYGTSTRSCIANFAVSQPVTSTRSGDFMRCDHCST